MKAKKMETTELNDMLHELVKIVPAYRGYAQREDRCQTDEAVREYTYNKLMGCRKAFERVVVKLIDKRLLDDIGSIDGMGRELLRLAISIRHRAYRACRNFDAVEMNPDVIASLCSYDISVLNYVKSINRFVRQYSKDILAGDHAEEEYGYAEYFFYGDWITGYDITVIERDFLIMESQ